MYSWSKYINTLLSRLKSFINNPTVVIYFVSIVAIVGSFGVWYPIFDYQNCNNSFWFEPTTLTNLSTYTISILAATMADFLLGNRERGKAFKIFVFSLFIVAFLSSIISLIKFKGLFGILGVVLTYFLWVIVFADDGSKGGDEIKDPKVSSGGSAPDKVELQGTLKEFKS